MPPVGSQPDTQSKSQNQSVAVTHSEIARLRDGLDRLEGQLNALETPRRASAERTRPTRYYEVLVGVYEHGRHGIAAGQRTPAGGLRMSAAVHSPLVSTDRLAAHYDDANVVVLEVDEQPLIYCVGHLPGARNVAWKLDLQDPATRDIPSPDAMRATWQALGITKRSTVVLYSDKNNWYACFAYWLFGYYGPDRLALLDGGRQRSLTQKHPVTAEISEPAGGHTWFVLHELLGIDDVRNYDGSWTEWGSMIGMPVQTGSDAGDPLATRLAAPL